MSLLLGMLGWAIIFLILWEAFETIILPRRVTRRLRLTSTFYRITWRPWHALGRRIRKAKRREAFLAYYGPLSTLLLISTWALGMIFGFALVIWSIGSKLQPPDGAANFGIDIYMSGTTFFTLGLGDVRPLTPLARALTVLEAGLGFGFLAIVVSYLPVLYQAFSRREVEISMMDSRAGSPSSAIALLGHYARRRDRFEQNLREIEHWCADLLESHISYPVLSYFRSQHDNQSWLTAITTILDTSALLMAGVKDAPVWEARLTFAMARHAVVDISQVLKQPPRPPKPERLPRGDLPRLMDALAEAGLVFTDTAAAQQTLSGLRALYEPYVSALATYLSMPLPPWLTKQPAHYNWQTSAWGTKQPPSVEDEHA